MEGKIIGRFRLGKPIRRGSLSTVYQTEETLGSGERRAVAMKLIASPNPQDPRYVEAFLREAAVQKRFAGLPGILEVLDAGDVHGQLVWVAMELAEGSLVEMISDEPANPALVVDMLGQVLKGLDRLHAFQRAPVLHRDIKPSNILVLGSSRKPRFALSDIELVGEDIPPMPCCPKRARYLAPEFCGNDARHESPASDIYSLGLVAYQMLLGNRLFDATLGVASSPSRDRADVGAWMQWHCSPGLVAPPAHAVVPGVSRALSEVVARMIAKPLDQRYSAALDVLRDLTSTRDALARPGDHGADHGADHYLGEATAQRGPRRRTPRWSVVAACATLGVGLVTTCAWAWTRPAPTVSIDQRSDLAGYGKERTVRVLAQQLPDDARVVFVMEGTSPRTMDRMNGPTSGFFQTTVELPRARRVDGEVVVVDAAGERIASHPIRLERFAPIDVDIETRPALPGGKLIVRKPEGGAQIEALTDGQGRVTLKLEPGEYAVSLEADRFEVTGVSVTKQITEEDAGNDLRWQIPVTALEGKLRASITPSTAQVRAKSATKGTRLLTLANGAGEVALEAGEWEISVEAEGWIGATERVLVPKGASTDIAIALREIPKPPPPPAPAAAPEPQPMSVDEVKRIAQSLIPIEQLEFAAVEFTNQVRISGCVFSEDERSLVSSRLKRVLERVELEIRVDPDLVVERIREELRQADVKFVTSRIKRDGDGVQLQIPRSQPISDAPARVRAVVSRFLLVPEHAKIRWYEQ